VRDRPETLAIDQTRHGEHGGEDGISLSASVPRDRKLGGGVIDRQVKNSKSRARELKFKLYTRQHTCNNVASRFYKIPSGF
jgi:hypothetical protein